MTIIHSAFVMAVLCFTASIDQASANSNAKLLAEIRRNSPRGILESKEHFESYYRVLIAPEADQKHESQLSDPLYQQLIMGAREFDHALNQIDYRSGSDPLRNVDLNSTPHKLLRLYNEQLFEKIRIQLKSTDPNAQKLGIELLNSHTVDGPYGDYFFLEALKDPDKVVRYQALAALKLYRGPIKESLLTYARQLRSNLAVCEGCLDPAIRSIGPVLDFAAKLNSVLSEPKNSAASAEQLVRKCCESITPGTVYFPRNAGTEQTARTLIKNNYTIEEHDSLLDPYATGNRGAKSWDFDDVAPDQEVTFEKDKDYQFELPAKFGELTEIKEDFRYENPKLDFAAVQKVIKDRKLDEKGYRAYLEENYFKPRLEEALPDKRPIQDYVTFAGEGSSSKAYFLHAKIPDELKADSEKRKAWAAANSNQVIKLRKHEDSANELRRDLILPKVFEQAVSQFKIKGEDGKFAPFFNAASYSGTVQEAKKGILRQATVRGKSGFEIANLVREAIKQREKQTAASLQKATEIEAELKGIGFKGLKDAARKINLAETMYRQIHQVMLDFRTKNQLPYSYNYLETRRASQKDIVQIVGADPNRGNNYFCCDEKGMFTAVDF